MKATSIQIIEILRSAGHQAYLAGGCVRDMLLNVEPKDFDIVTSAKPDEIEKLLEHTIPVGKEFGVILAIKNGHKFEIATFRSDSGYSDGRRPDAIEFKTAKEDALRRDFTINALFYDPIKEEVIDYVDGQTDLRDKLIRFIGDPQQRIKEDNLRILRAVRFKNAFNFQYHPATYQALKANAALVKNVSSERVRDELNKIIITKNPGQAFEELYELGILEHIIPELCRLKGLAQPLQYHKEGDVWDHSIKALNSLTNEEADPDPLPGPPTLTLKWATFLHDIGKYETFSVNDERIHYNHHAEIGAKTTEQILRRLNFPKKEMDRICWLIAHHMMVENILTMDTGRRRHWFLLPGFAELLEVYRADALGTIPSRLDKFHEIKKLYRHEIAELRLMPKQLITGEQVMEILNLPPGEKIGEILMDIREKQLAGKIKNEQEAIEYLNQLL